MNPWWKRPSPGDGNRGPKQRRSSSGNTEPSRLTDTLNDAEEISEIEGDLFVEDEPRKPRKPRKRKRRGGRSGGKNLVGLALCDVEALGHYLSASSGSASDLFAQLWASRAPKRMMAYAGSQADSRLCDELKAAGFEIAELDDDQIAPRMVVDTWAVLDDLHPADSVVLIADHPAVVPLAQHLVSIDRRTFVHQVDDNPMAEQCGLTVATPAPERSERDRNDERSRDRGPRDQKASQSEDSRRRRDQPEERPAQQSRGRDRSSENGNDRQETTDSPRRSRGGRGRSGGRDNSRRSAAPQVDPFALLDGAIKELVERGPSIVWATLVRQECLRQAPGFDETQYGFDSFHAFLEEAQKQNRIELTYVDDTESWVVSAWSPAA